MKNPLEFHMMVGISGSGKSTVAQNLFSEDGQRLIYLSSDKLRGIIGTSEGDQDPKLAFIVFKTIKNMAEYFLSLKQSVVLDATFLRPRYRAEYLDVARLYDATTYAHYVRTPMHVAMERSLNRKERVVPAEIIQRQFNDLIAPTLNEFDVIQEYSFFPPTGETGITVLTKAQL